MSPARETIEFDVLFVGGGPACLCGAIHLAQSAKKKGVELEIALIDKGADIGSHAVSGAILNPKALCELYPDYRSGDCPIEGTVTEDALYFLTAKRHFRAPITPRDMNNHGMRIISQSKFTRWLAGKAEILGINLFPGFTGTEVLYGPDGRTVAGVRTGDKGLKKDGAPGKNFEPGIDVLAKVTVFGEGARGSLTKMLRKKLGLDAGKTSEVFEVGIKEVIQLPEDAPFTDGKGRDYHFAGYPLDLHTPGGGFLYEMANHRVSIGFLAALSYTDPRFDPYETFIRFKRHPFIAEILKGGKIVEQGARTVSSGGYYAMPKPYMGGGLLVGGGAGVQNMPALKGIHVSMKSGMLAAETALEAIGKGDTSERFLSQYQERFEQSWAGQEMWAGRNYAQALGKKFPVKFLLLGAQYVTKGKGFIDPMAHRSDDKTLKPMDSPSTVPGKLEAAAYDGALTVDKLTGVYLSKTSHREDEPCHLLVHDKRLCVEICWPKYASPCTRFCPGNVYEMVEDETTGRRQLKLNPSNCFHCKTCDIKDPYENITWVCPEGGEGPGYTVV